MFTKFRVHHGGLIGLNLYEINKLNILKTKQLKNQFYEKFPLGYFLFPGAFEL